MEGGGAGELMLADYLVIAIYVVFALGVGSWFVKKASTGTDSFFVGDRKLPWWLAGTSIVATTFAADTPLAVTGIVAADGVSGNWIWWSWAIAHLSATFFFARMWRRSGVITDAEITELRYAGKPAAFLRAFKAVYFGIFINCLTMAWVIAAMVKISLAFFAVEPATVIAACVLVSVTYTTLGGFRGVVITDVVQFTLGMLGAVLVAWLVVSSLGGIGDVTAPDSGDGLVPRLSATLGEAGERTARDVLGFTPAGCWSDGACGEGQTCSLETGRCSGADSEMPASLPPLFFLVLLVAGWWRYAEGNGYIVQRLAACKDEGHAQGASLWFAVAHNALRPWPWILVGLASLIVYPQLPGEPPEQLAGAWQDATASGDVAITPGKLDVATGGELAFSGPRLEGCTATVFEQTHPIDLTDAGGRARFERFEKSGVTDVLVRCGDVTQPPVLRAPGLHVELTDREMGYPLMMREVLPTGLLGLVIASLLAAFMSTIDTHTNWGASYLVQDVYRRFIRKDADERHYVTVSRACIVLMAVLAGVTAAYVTSIAGVWRFLITLGAGLGSVTAMRWYWSRVTPWAELAAMATTTVVAVYLELSGDVANWAKIMIVAGASLATWVPVALLGPKNDEETLERFAERVRPPGPGWSLYRTWPAERMLPTVLRFLAGIYVVFGTLFGIGDLLLGRPGRGALALVVAGGLLAWIIRSGGQSASRSDHEGAERSGDPVAVPATEEPGEDPPP